MAWGAHVWVNTTVCTVCATALLLRTVDLNVVDEELVNVKALELGVSLSVAQKVQDELCRLLWPPGLSVGSTCILGLGCAADTTAEATEGNSLLVLDDVLQVSLSLLQHHTLDCVACLAGVLEVNTDKC